MGKLGGRPTLLTDERSNKILNDVGDGAYISTACVAAGISRQTFYNWMKWAGQGKSPYARFFDALKTVEAQAEIDKMRDMLKGGKDFLPNATFLERRHRARWGRSDKMVTANPDESMRVNVLQLVLNRPSGDREFITFNRLSQASRVIEFAAPKDVTPQSESK